MPTTLVDWLRTLDDEELARLLALRPDLAVPPPADLTVLATRSAVRASVHRACDTLDTAALSVLEAGLVAGADTQPVPLSELARLLGAPVPPGALPALRERALLWGPDEALSLVPAAREVGPTYPGGLGRPATGPAGSSALPDLLAATEPDERKVLAALSAGPPIGRSRAAGNPDSPVGRLLARGLLLRVNDETVELPRQVGLALRGDRPMGAVTLTPPKVVFRERGAEVVDRTAGGAALEVLRRLDLLIEHWGRTGTPVLRSGGLGVRELRRAAREMDTDEPGAALLIELAYAADLVGEADGAAPEWAPTTTADVWAAGGPETRWHTIAHAWLSLPRTPGLIGSRDENDRPIPALSPALRRPGAPRDRRLVLSALAELPAGAAPTATEELARLLAWRTPRGTGPKRDDAVRWVLAEATVLGVVALDALTGPGRALLDNPDGVVAALRATLPEPVDHVLLQADLTAVAPGPLETMLAHELSLMADVESAGGATVYRFTESTIRRALDSGRSAADLHALFQKRSRTPVPQALTYLVDDVARKHGQLRGGTAASFLRSEDEVLIAEVLAHPDTGPLELRRIAPTVAVSPLPLVELLDGLRAAGFSPAAEDTIGAVLDLAERGRRISGRRANRPAMATPPDPGADHLAQLVARMRKGETLAGARPGQTRQNAGNGVTLDVLRTAAAANGVVWIGYVDAHGVAGERVLEPLSIGGGVVEGRDVTDHAVYRVPLHRITGITAVND